MVHHVIHINKSVPYEIFDIYIKEDETKYVHKKPYVVYSSHEYF